LPSAFSIRSKNIPKGGPLQRGRIKANDLIGFWSSFLAASGATLRALDLAGGVDAAFVLGSEAAFSARLSS